MKVLVQHWTESEAGWGNRPDGVSVHFSGASHKLYVDAYWEAMNIKHGTRTPDEYEYPDGKPVVMVFDAEHADEHILAKVLREQDWRDFKNSPKYLKKSDTIF